MNDDHLAAGLVCLHHAVRLTNLLEAEDPGWLDVEPAGRGIRGNLLKRHVLCGQVRSGLVWGFSCQAVVLGCADSFLFGAGKAVFRRVALDQVRGGTMDRETGLSSKLQCLTVLAAY